MSEAAILALVGQIIRDFPSDELNKDLKEVYNFKSQYNHKAWHTCQHEGCEAPSCGSHEISNSLFLAGLADENEEVRMIGPKFRGNAFELEARGIKARYATVFGGYCSRHDDELFSSFENGNFSMDADFLHKQALRTIRKEAHLRQSHLAKLLSTRDELYQDGSPLLLTPEFRRLGRIIRRTELILAKHWQFYARIWDAITRKEQFIYFRTLQLPPKQMAFACACTDIRKDSSPYLFVFVLPGKENTLVLGVPAAYRSIVDDIFSASEYELFEYVNAIICDNYSRLVVSSNYLDGLGPVERAALAHTPEHGNRLAIRIARLLN